MVRWSVKKLKKGDQLEAESDALTRDELQTVFIDQWTCLIRDVLPQHDQSNWNSIVAGIQLWHGTVSLMPCLNLDIEKQLPGNTLYLGRIHDAIESVESEEQLNRYFENCQLLVVETLVDALEASQSGDVYADRSAKRHVAFEIITEPEEPALYSKTILI